MQLWAEVLAQMVSRTITAGSTRRGQQKENIDITLAESTNGRPVRAAIDTAGVSAAVLCVSWG
jgi:hypothetical protein